MNNNSLPLSSEFKLELLRRFIEDNPEKDSKLALKYCQEYYEIYQEYKALKEAHLKSIIGLFM